MSPLLPQYNSPPRRSSSDHSLGELSPRPDDAPLYAGADSPNTPSRGHMAEHEMPDSSPRFSAKANSKGKGKAVAIAYQGQPRSWYQQLKKPSFVPPTPYDVAEESFSEPVQKPLSESFIESIFPRRPRPAETSGNSRFQVDDTFREIARRERQMQKELQKLLDAQAAAIEQKLDDSPFSGKGKPRDAGNVTPKNKRTEQSPTQPVIPVRQPPEKTLSLGQARSHIIGVMQMLASLKTEEDAYIASALAERKAGLSKLTMLKNQHQQIKKDIHEIEKDPADVLTNEIRTIEGEVQTVSSQIEEYKRLLKRAEQTKAALERRLEEAKSEAESRLSGYKGALRECEAGMRDLVRRPRIRVLEPAQFRNQGEEGEAGAAADGHITGIEFFRLRPERRTLPMARDWWEGEMAVLERRRAAVERERAALEEGERVWADVIDTIERHEEQLAGALSGSGSPADVLRGQWDLLQEVTAKLERTLAHVEGRSWRLLVAAVGAELSVYHDAREMLRSILRSMGLSPRERSPGKAHASTYSSGGDGNLVCTGERDAGQARSPNLSSNADRDQEHEELGGSVIRRWEDPDQVIRRPSPEGGNRRSPDPDRNDHPSAVPSDLIVDEQIEEPEDKGLDDTDNEVPAGLLNETQREESEDERHRDENEVPPEFLSLRAGDATGVAAAR
ncbi:hypothetical protein DL766_003655 [Monosporascus sp. MC13-8B]|uniref:Autophagy-related protein 28 n=1 Tax=Monosporascus cannonballus TaxID=155416 RepID=A0ABY0H7F8_9PEZI|nr:hypothetical protein DL763_009747 [Monosporascus cannonballus]RYO86062.1 hypothetical protein DL762_004940 [Monosporascus cannonballus]RYP33155.1 hypothetical protein DL766_003655 [Monosporascus sp. MC13-8B]